MLSISRLAPEEDNLSKALVYYCFRVFHHIGEYIFLDLLIHLFQTCINNESFYLATALVPISLYKIKGEKEAMLSISFRNTLTEIPKRELQSRETTV